LIFHAGSAGDVSLMVEKRLEGTVVEIVYERVAAIDVGKKEVAVTVRVPGQTPGTRTQQTRKFRTFYQVLRQMVGWLVDHGVTHVAMEARAPRVDLTSTPCARPTPWRWCWSTPGT
jgi:hypothetical protein